jgi:hypothetical protein
MNALKSIGAVLAGFVVVVITSVATDIILEAAGLLPPQDQPQLTTPRMLGWALFYRTLYTVLGGYVTAWLAPRKPMAHAIALGVLGMAVGTLGAVVMWKLGNNWYPIALVVEAIPCTWIGAKLYMKRGAAKTAVA